MAQRIRALYGSLTIATLLMGVAMGCGDDGGGGDDDDDPGDAGGGGEPASGGSNRGGSGGASGGREPTAGSTSGGRSGSGGTSNNEGGESSDAGKGGEGGGAGEGPAPKATGIDDVVAAVCDWEFRCCDDGERTYRLSPFADTAEKCASRLIYEMRQSNATANPYKSGPAAPGGLLGILGYTVDLDRVGINAAGIGECVESLEERDCTKEPVAGARCSGPPGEDPCALTNLFTPKLGLNAECTLGLAEGVGNDVECMVGSTCLPADDPDNPKDVPSCVKRGLDGDPCTEDNDCDFDFYCDAGECTAKGDPGDDCSFEDPEDPQPEEVKAQCKAGLTCHPGDRTCIEPCSEGYTCTADAQCPSGMGCAPIEVGESTTVFQVCTELGRNAAALCNSDADCVDAYYCDGAKCQADKAADATCTAQNQCATGLHCDIGTAAPTNKCVTNLALMAACTQNYQCAPGSAGCVNIGTSSICRNALLAVGGVCGNNAACLSGRCEIATNGDTEMKCVAGGEEDDVCDTLTGDGLAVSCGPGLYCDGMPSMSRGGRCVTQVGAGESCVNAEKDPQATLCANGGTCTDPWNEGEICTDAAIPKPNGGTGLVCDGS